MFVWSPVRPRERIADGVWLVRGGVPSKIMNVYLIEDAGGVTVFDAGISGMTDAVATAGADLGGINAVVLGHADADHRGAAPGLPAPVYCHEADRAAAESPKAFRDYWDLGKLSVPASLVMPKLLRHWDGGAVSITGTLAEGDEVAGFRVIHLPGHAPGLIGLFRESDRLALCSDCIYTIDVQTGLRSRPRVPHPAFNLDTEQARASIRKLAEHEPAVAWPGHAHPVRGDVRAQLLDVASA
jgi:hydroxyacylglutathione hydrolase